MENFIETYNPRNASKLTEEQIQAMQELTDDQIRQLAEAYPNQPTGNAYLRYFMKNEPADKQRFPLGTWKNLHSLRKLGKSEIVAFGFMKGKLPAAVKNVPVGAKKTVDLSSTELLEGMKAANEEITDPNFEAMDDFNDVLGDAENVSDGEANQSSEAVLALQEAQQNLDEAKAAGAHPQTIKSLERKLVAAQEVVDAEKI